jgi:predicted dehydrogenase
MKLGVVGSGAVVPFHLDALVANGFEVVSIASRPGSTSSKALAEQFGAVALNDFWEVSRSGIDAVLVAPATTAIQEPLIHFLRQRIPMLVEKPVLRSAVAFSELGDLENQNVLVGYNRRFYSSVQELLARLQQKNPHSFLFKVPENSWNGLLDSNGRSTYLLDNTVHMIDLVRYLSGNSEVSLTITAGSGQKRFEAINVMIEGNKISGVLQITFNSPGAYSIEFNGVGFISRLQPIEHLSYFDSMDVIEPTREIPIRRYRPKLSPNQFKISQYDLEFKPGFYQQAAHFASIVQGKKSLIGANLFDAYKAIEFVEQIKRSRG